MSETSIVKAETLGKVAVSAQGALVDLLLTENSYESYDFQRFFVTLGKLNERFDAIRDNETPHAKEAVRKWDDAIADLAKCLNLYTRDQLEARNDADDDDQADVKGTLEAVYGKLDQYRVSITQDAPLALPDGYGEYLLIPIAAAMGGYSDNAE